MIKVLVYVKDPNPRLNYVFQHMKGYFANLSFELCNDASIYKEWAGISIQCGHEKMKDREWQMPLSDYLNWPLVQIIKEGEPFLQKICCEPKVYPGVDLISAIFWHLSRIEEYFPHLTDAHGRYQAKNSLLYQKNVLRLPLVDIWIMEWKKQLEELFGIPLQLKESTPAWSVGIDVDQFYKHRYKSCYKKLGGTFKDFFTGNLSAVRERLGIYSGRIKDPFDSYDRIKEMRISKDALCFFILSGGHTSFDQNHSLHQKVILHKIEALEKFAMVGIHPSYESMANEEVMTSELKNLEHCCSSSLKRSRQHYLRCRIPDTYRLLLKAGILVDYSMGYAEQPGYRASCCRPFYWYDLENEMATPLLIVPFSAMDRTYLSYLKFGADQAKRDILEMWQTSKKYHGHFHLIWHNSSFDFNGEWRSWEGVFEEIVNRLKEDD